jgi:hypothetical protein
MQSQGKHYTWQFARDAMYVSDTFIRYPSLSLTHPAMADRQFYAFSLNRHEQLGKIYPAKDGTTVFEASDLLISRGMLDSAILATTLLLSERFRD